MASEESRTQRMTFHYLKRPSYHAYQVNGVIGGPTPRGYIHASFFSERFPIPQRTTHTLNASGGLEAEIPDERVSKAGVIRELECGIYIDLIGAKELRAWLDEKIKELETAYSAQEK